MSKTTPNNQSAFERVNRCIVEKLKSNWGLSFSIDKVNDYVVSLGKFDAKTLENAMIFLMENCEDAPRLATIIKACKEHKTVTHSHSEPPDVWLRKRYEEEELKMTRAKTKAKDYFENKVSEIRNRIEAWSDFKKRDIYDYLAKTAQYQAIRLEKVTNPGYMTPFIVCSGDNPDKRLDWWKTMNTEAKDDINVVIPWLWFEGKEQEAVA